MPVWKRFQTGISAHDFETLRALARELDISMTIVESAIRDYEKLVEAGDGENDISGLIRLKRKPAEKGGTEAGTAE
jgi:3-hydroxyisobutyrate dehydrogenase